MKKAFALTLASVLAVGLVACSAPASSSTPAPAATDAPASSSVASSSAPASSTASDSAAAQTTITGTVSKVTDTGFTLTQADGTAMDFVLDAASTLTGKDALVEGANLSITFTGDATSADAATRVPVTVTPADGAELMADASTSASGSASASGSTSTSAAA